MIIRIVAHCLLNPHTRIAGLSPVGKFEKEGSLIQLPCPELIYSGAHRWEVTREQLGTSNYRRFCKNLLTPFVDMIEELAREKNVTFEVVGVSKSPSCACETTTIGYKGGRIQSSEHAHVKDKGIFIEELQRELQKRGISVHLYDA